MRRIAHLSDLHFGAHDPDVADALREDLLAEEPDLVAISGDLTQRARSAQFAEARAWLDRLPFPALIVPGNHDVPMTDLLARAFRPMVRYRRYIAEDLDPSWEDDELAVLGVNTARALTVSSGRISHEQIAQLTERLARTGDSRFKVILTHHPFLPPAGRRRGRFVGRGLLALRTLERGAADLLLAGHHHRGLAGDVRDFHVSIRRSILVGHAGTAISYRRRGEPNAYQMVSIARRHVAFAVRFFDGARFTGSAIHRFAKHRGVWHRSPSRAAGLTH